MVHIVFKKKISPKLGAVVQYDQRPTTDDQRLSIIGAFRQWLRSLLVIRRSSPLINIGQKSSTKCKGQQHVGQKSSTKGHEDTRKFSFVSRSGINCVTRENVVFRQNPAHFFLRASVPLCLRVETLRSQLWLWLRPLCVSSWTMEIIGNKGSYLDAGRIRPDERDLQD